MAMDLIHAWFIDLVWSLPLLLGISFAGALSIGAVLRVAGRRQPITRLFIYFSLGALLLGSSVWLYLAFQAASREPQGSFRIRGAVYAERVSQQWGFQRLRNLIENRWLYRYPFSDAIPAPIMARERMSDGLLRAEAFRFRLLDDDSTSARRIAQAVLAFNDSLLEAPDSAALPLHYLDENSFVDALQGSADINNAEACLQALRGSWRKVSEHAALDRHWSRIEHYETPDALCGASLQVNVSAMQYAWADDSFGWNAITQTERGQVILGVEYRMDRESAQRVYRPCPTVGLAVNPRQMIWISENSIRIMTLHPESVPYHLTISALLYTIDQDAFVIDVEVYKKYDSLDPTDPISVRYPFQRLANQ